MAFVAPILTPPGGSTTQLQYNNAGVFGGTSGLTWNGTNLAWATSQEAQFRQTTNRLYSRATDILTLEGNVTTEVGKDGDCRLFGSTLRTVYPSTDLKADLGLATTNRINAVRAQSVHIIAGSSTGEIAKGGGTLNANVTSVANVGTGEDDLMTYSVPANTLGTNGMYLKFRGTGSFSSSANNKRIRIKWGATTILDTGAATIPISAAATWVFSGTVYRTTGSTAQMTEACLWTSCTGYIFFVGQVGASETLTGAVTLKATGEATTNNDIVQTGLWVEWGCNA